MEYSKYNVDKQHAFIAVRLMECFSPAVDCPETNYAAFLIIVPD